MEIISTNALITINATSVVQLVFFLLFVFTLNKMLMEPIRKVVSKRNDYIKNIEREIDKTNQDLKKFVVEFKDKKVKIIDESSLLAEQLQNEGSLKAKNIHAKTRDTIISFQKKSDQEIEKRVDLLKKNLYREIDKISSLITDKILDRSLIK